MTKNYLVGGITAIAFFFVVGYDYYTGNISVSARKVVERATSEISDLSGLQEALQGGDEADAGDVTDVSSDGGDLSGDDAADGGDMSDGTADGGEISGDDSGDISGDDGGDMADGTADDGDVSDVSGDISDFGNADIADFGNADISDFGNADIADFGNADVSDFGNADIADFGNADIADLGNGGDISDLSGLGGFDIADLLADSDLLGGLSDLAGLLGGNNGGDVSGDGSGLSNGIEDDFAAGRVSIYSFPNPANNIANFRFQLNEGARVQIALYGASGQLVDMVLTRQYGPGEYVHTYDVSALTPGVYVYSFQLNNNLPVTRKMIVK